MTLIIFVNIWFVELLQIKKPMQSNIQTLERLKLWLHGFPILC